MHGASLPCRQSACIPLGEEPRRRSMAARKQPPAEPGQRVAGDDLFSRQCQQDAVAVLLDGLDTMPFTSASWSAFELAVGFAPGNDGFGLGHANAVQRFGDGGGIGVVDVDAVGNEGGRPAQGQSDRNSDDQGC